MEQDVVTLSLLTIMTALLRKQQQKRSRNKSPQRRRVNKQSKQKKEYRRTRKTTSAATTSKLSKSRVTTAARKKPGPVIKKETKDKIVKKVEVDIGWNSEVEYETYLEATDYEEEMPQQAMKVEAVEEEDTAQIRGDEVVNDDSNDEHFMNSDEEHEFIDEETLEDDDVLQQEQQTLEIEDANDGTNASSLDFTNDYEVSTAIDMMTRSMDNGEPDTEASMIPNTSVNTGERTLNKNGQPRAKRSAWCREYLLLRHYGQDIMSNSEYDLKDPIMFKEFARMSMETFTELLDMVGPLIKKKPTSMRPAISARIRLLVTLRYLATGDKYGVLEKLFRISIAAISNIISATLPTIYYVLKEKYLMFPETPSGWTAIADEFETKWDFPQCLGAVDGVHIAITDRKSYKGRYRNYQGQNSVVLLAIVDANFKFIYIKTTSNEGIQDPAALMEEVLQRDDHDFPNDGQLPAFVDGVPFVFTGNDAFKLTNRLLTPYSRATSVSDQIFNSRLSRANHVAERAFGMVANTFEVLKGILDLPAEKVETILFAACSLHNFIRTVESANNETIDDAESTPWRGTGRMMGLQLSVADNDDDEYSRVRNIYSEYFNSTSEYLWE